MGPICEKNSAEKSTGEMDMPSGPSELSMGCGAVKILGGFEMARKLARTPLAIFTVALILPAAPAQAQQAPFPTRPITLIVPFAPGGAPDGYTLVLATTSQLINQFLSKSPPFNLFADLVPVALIADAPEVIAISSKLGVASLKEFARAAQTDAAGFNYGSPGTGSVPHLGGEALGRAMKAKVVHVPFRGSADAAKDVAAGSVQFTLATQATVAPFVDSNLVKIIAVAAPRRLRTLPDVPTTAEAGYPGVELSNWFGVMGPRGMSPQLVALLNRSFNKALAHPEVESALLRQGIEPVRETPEQFAARLQDDAQTYKRLLDDFGLAPQ